MVQAGGDLPGCSFFWLLRPRSPDFRSLHRFWVYPVTEICPEAGDLFLIGLDDVERCTIAGFPERHQDPPFPFIDPHQHGSSQENRDLAELVPRRKLVILMADLPDPVITASGGDVLEDYF